MNDDDREFSVRLHMQIENLTNELENVTQFLDHVDPSEKESIAYLEEMKDRLQSSLNSLHHARPAEPIDGEAES